MDFPRPGKFSIGLFRELSQSCVPGRCQAASVMIMFFAFGTGKDGVRIYSRKFEDEHVRRL